MVNQRRWLVIPLGMIVMLCLGTVYAWSIFRKPLEQEIGLNATASLLPYTFALFFYSLLMPITGFYIPRLGTRRVTAIGGDLWDWGIFSPALPTVCPFCFSPMG